MAEQRPCSTHCQRQFHDAFRRPKTVEQGEWIAHQGKDLAVHFMSMLSNVLFDSCRAFYRILWNFVRVIHDKDEDGTSICNAQTCPRMSAST